MFSHSVLLLCRVPPLQQELGHRLKLAGYKLVDVSKLINTYHLYHPTRKTRREETREKIRKVDASTESRCQNGLVKEG